MSAHRPVLIINAEIADPLTGRTERGSLAIEDGMIHDFGRAIDTPPEGAVIIDVGTTRVDDPTRKSGWRLCGDVDYDAVFSKVSAITPVPKGVGPMTITGLMMNTLEVYKAKFA